MTKRATSEAQDRPPPRPEHLGPAEKPGQQPRIRARPARPAAQGKLSDFGVQLRAKQKLKGYYGNISERQFKNIYYEAIRRTGDTSEHLVGLLESRLDAIVYRAKFVPTVFAARQFVNHGHVLVNGKRVTIPSYRAKPGDVISLKDSVEAISRSCCSASQTTERDVPDYIDADHGKMTATFVSAAGVRRRAVSGPDGAASGGRVLFALARRRWQETKGRRSAAFFDSCRSQAQACAFRRRSGPSR